MKQSLCVVDSQVVHRDAVLLQSLQSSTIFTSPISDDNLIVSNGSASAGVLSVWSWAAPEPFLNNKVTDTLLLSLCVSASHEAVHRRWPLITLTLINTFTAN